MAEYELQLTPMDFSYEYASNLSTPTFSQHWNISWRQRLRTCTIRNRENMIVLPGCTLHTEIGRNLNHMVRHDQQRIVMMEFYAELCPGDYEDKGNGFNGTVEIDVDNHKEDWNREYEEVCGADISQQSIFLSPSIL